MADKKTKKPRAKPVYIYIMEFGQDGEPAKVCEKMPVQPSNLYASYIERCTRGIMRNMDLERFYVDTDEADKAAAARAKAKA